FLLLLVEFRSIFVPIKAALMNLLSVGAAYGAVVAIFQWGWLSDVFGAQPGPIESFAPMMLFAVLFGLSMDYEVFLLSRVREEYLRTGQAGAAVADGIAATARVITAAASVMVVVFASFLLNDDRVVNLFGFGLAVAIAIDATLVRLVLVPALMAVAGRLAWYMPRWMDRILPKIELEPHPVDPFEEGLDELDPDRREIVLAGAGSEQAGEATQPAEPGPAATGAHAERGLDDPRAALDTLRDLIVERDAYRQDYLETLAELERFREQYDNLVQALRTVQGAAIGGNGVPLETRRGSRRRRVDVAPQPPGRDDGTGR
ncbi:MMPL family transporter, partial [Nocardioides sp.]|uniref:MMPL family transporter n=1 Tax=Nocardioides sp. TaxID=35761 RepID=UPI002ED77BBE